MAQRVDGTKMAALQRARVDELDSVTNTAILRMKERKHTRGLLTVQQCVWQLSIGIRLFSYPNP